MEAYDEFETTLVQVANLLGYPNPSDNAALVTALRAYVDAHKTQIEVDALFENIDKGACADCFLPAVELRNILHLPKGGGVPKGELGLLYLNAIKGLQARGWSRRVRVIRGVQVVGYGSALKNAGILHYDPKTNTVYRCKPADYFTES